MVNDLKSRIDCVLTNHDNVRKNKLEYNIASNIQKIHMLDRFIDIRRDVIRSVMDQFACHFRDILYNCLVVNDDHNLDEVGRRISRASITLRIYKGAILGDDLRFVPHYSVVWDDANAVARYYMNNSTKNFAGETRYDGKSDLHEITSDLIEAKLLSFTRWVFEDNSI